MTARSTLHIVRDPSNERNVMQNKTRNRVRKTVDKIKKHRVAIQAVAIGSVAAYYTTSVVWQVRSDRLRQDMAHGTFMIPLEKPNRYVRIPVMYDPDAEEPKV